MRRFDLKPVLLLIIILLLTYTVAWCDQELAEEAEFLLKVIDKDTGEPTAARVRIRDANGKDHIPPGATNVRIGPDFWFVTDGRTTISVPPGNFEIRVERGTEFRPLKTTIDVSPGVLNEHTVALERWIDMRELGYVCGENHLHVPIEQLGPQLAAEGLDFGTSLQWWNGPAFEVPKGEGFVRFLEFGGTRTPASVYDFEIEHNWGAVYVIGMPTELTATNDLRRPNLPIVKDAHKDGALVCYQAGWSREVLLNALLGCVDVVNVCNNNFHRHRYQPRSQYSNMLNVEGLPTYPNTAEGMMLMNTDTYYRLLNCGLRLAAGAGSATGAKRNPVGYNRAYVRAGANPTLPQFLQAWREGRNFVTNGPMLFLTIDGKYMPGDTVALARGGGKVEISVEAISEQPLTSIEVVVNGRVLEAKPEIDGARGTLTLRTEITEGSWIAARCTEEDRFLSDEEMAAYDSPGVGSRLARPCRLRFAHTSPVYVTVDGKSALVTESLEEGRRMLDAFAAFAAGEAADDHRAAILAAVDEARKRLNSSDTRMGDEAVRDSRTGSEAAEDTVLITYPAPEGADLSDQYEVKVNGKPLDIYIAPVWEPGYGKSFGGPYSFAYFDFSGTVEVQVRSSEPLDRVRILPESRGIKPVVKGGALTFKLSRHCQLSIEPDGKNGPLLLFANPPENDPPKPDDPNVKYFGPGVHKAGEIILRDNETLYIAGGAVVKGGVLAQGSNISIRGRGIIDGLDWEFAKGPTHYLVCTFNSSYVSVEGIILKDSWLWTMVFVGSSDVHIDNVKIWSARCEHNDGINSVNSQRVVIENSFIRSDDDCITTKGQGFLDRNPESDGLPVEDIIVRNCVLWTDRAHIWRLGCESWAAGMRNLLFQNIDVLHWDGAWMATVQPAEGMLMEDVRFENIRVNGEGQTHFIEICPDPTQWAVRRNTPGMARNVHFKNVVVSGEAGDSLGLVKVHGSDAEHTVEGVTFENVIRYGRRLTNDCPDITINEYTKDIVFK